MTIAVYSPNGAVSTSDSSHRSAWPKMVLDSLGVKDFVLQPKNSLANYEEVWLYLGMEWSGALNLFGGASAENAEKLTKLLDAKNLKFLTTEIDHQDCPLLGTIAKQRNEKAAPEWQQADWDSLDDLCRKMDIVDQGEKEYIVVGDSHALSLYDGLSNIWRYDHKTLHGASEIGLAQLFPNWDFFWKRITLCFGNIDLQHHLGRFDKSATLELAENYIQQASKLECDKIELVELLPIFPETRKIATPGYYKGKPWFGSWSQRNELRELFNSHLTNEAKKHKHLSIVRWPEYIYGKDGEFSAAYQEKPRGVHLSWSHRRQTWGV